MKGQGQAMVGEAGPVEIRHKENAKAVGVERNARGPIESWDRKY
jgi:hypothetical protein